MTQQDKYVLDIFNKRSDKRYYKKFIKITAKGKIIDLGCGVGSASNLFTKAGYEYVGYDIDEYNINLGKQYNPKLDINVANIIDIPKQIPKANGAVYAYSLLGLTTNEVKQSFKSCYENLIDDGNILIFTRCKDFDGDKPPFYVNVIPREELLLILENIGFRTVYNKIIDDTVVCIIATKRK